MDALTAPRAPRKTEIPCQPRSRGMDEGDSKSSSDSAQSRHHEASKPRGMFYYCIY